MPSPGRWRTSDLPPEWAKSIRPAILARDPICRWGMLQDETGYCTYPSEQVDHLGDPDNHDPAHLRGICAAHHRIRTGRQGAVARHALRPRKNRPPEKHPGYK